MVSTARQLPATTDDLAPRLEAGLAWLAERGCGAELVARARAVLATVAALGVQEDIALAGMLAVPLRTGAVSEEDVRQAFGLEIAALAVGARDLPQVQPVALPGRDYALQSESLRKMLLAMVRDVRVVVIRLAEHLQDLRDAREAPDAERRRLAFETREIYAPLANRLGIWRIKWELEDLAFRYLDPETYRRIANWLKQRRADRETFIEQVVRMMQDMLAQAGIHGEVHGRPKHLYSIWRKMQRKQIDFEHVYDVHAVRVLVDTVADCYAVLGLVHGRWPHIPGEFDDYIATPKGNYYRSLHTAVVGPDGRPLEIQIRTYEMDRHAELGVAAHWRYKEGAARDPALEQRIVWLRQLLEAGDAQRDTANDFIDRFKSEFLEDRVYVLTPKGEVVDLPAGATPLDFAYHVHTDLGHRCRGARVNGRMVPLTYRLENGDQVEIITVKRGGPSRDWLVPQLGYLVSARARDKVRHWFRQQDFAQNVTAGREIVERELARLGVHDMPLEAFVPHFNAANVDGFLAAVGSGDISAAQLAGAIQRHSGAARLPEPAAPATKRGTTRTGRASAVAVQGVGDLLTTFARCCRPVPPDAIVGYITRGRGVTVHRADCANVIRYRSTATDRLVDVAWGETGAQTFPVEIVIMAHDRRGLVADIGALLAAEKVNILALQGDLGGRDGGTANIRATIEITDLEQLSRVLARLARLPGIIGARRRTG